MGSVQIIYKVPLCPKIDVLVGAEGKWGVCRSKLQEHDGWFLPTCYFKRQGTSGNNYMCTEVNSQEAKPFRAMLLFLTDKDTNSLRFMSVLSLHRVWTIRDHRKKQTDSNWTQCGIFILKVELHVLTSPLHLTQAHIYNHGVKDTPPSVIFIERKYQAIRSS